MPEPRSVVRPPVCRLGHKGLLLRTRSEADEREVFVTLTPAGRELKERMVRVPIDMLSRCPMSIDELRSLREQLKRLQLVAC